MREIDKLIREIMNEVRAKYKLQANASLYLPRCKGGRGIKNLESTYKKTKVVAATKLMTTVDRRMDLVRKFEIKRMERVRSSILTDAIRYASEDFGVTFEPLENDFVVHYEKDGKKESTSKKDVVKEVLKKNATKQLNDQLTSATWQGVIFKTRNDDIDINMNQCFAWLSSWKEAPVEIINNFQSIYLQTVPTLTFMKNRGHSEITSTTCRMCGQGEESVKHLLSNCGKFVNHAYKRRHDRVLQYIMLKFLHKNAMITSFPPWFTKICIKPRYVKDDIEVLWDIPEYSGYDTELENGPLRPDGKIIDNKSKSILVLEMSIPWITNRKTKLEEKEGKYKDIVQSLKIDNPGYQVKQVTFITDCMGGYSTDLIDNLKLLSFTRSDIDSILPGIQRIVVTEATSVIDHFKVSTMA